MTGEEDVFESEVRAGGNREFEVFEKNLKTLKSFDLLLFRGSDPVSDSISKLTTKHRGVDFFSHVGICLTTPLLPREGHCMKRGECEATAKVLPCVQLRLQLRDAKPSSDPAMPHDLSITVLQCCGLPSRLDEGGTKEDPYVRVSLTPSGSRSASQVGLISFRTKTVRHGGHNPQFGAHHNNTAVLQLPAAPHPQRPPQLRIQIWDEDRISPDDLIGVHHLNLDGPLLQQLMSKGGTTRWLLLDVSDGAADGSISSKIRLPNYHRPEDISPEGIKRIAADDHVHDLTLGPERKPPSENYTAAAARRMSNFLVSPATAYLLRISVNHFIKFHIPILRISDNSVQTDSQSSGD